MIAAYPATVAAVLLATLHAQPAPPLKELLPGFHRSPWFGEQVREQWIEGDVRIVVNVAGDYDAKRPTRLVVFATPNGNTIEQTLGCGPALGLDWHFFIQHV